MGKLGFVLVALAACASDRGIVIAVDPTTITVDEIRLFVGVGDSGQALLQPPQQVSYLTPDGATFWARDPYNSGDRIAVTDGKAVSFTFVGGDAKVLPAMIAVGYLGGEAVAAATMVETPIPDEDFFVYTMTLEPRTQEFDFQVWSPDLEAPQTEAACAGVFDTRVEAKSGLIVTSGDRDCDGAGDNDALECDPDVYRSSTPPTRDHLTCTTLESSNHCVLGGPQCVDGQGRVASDCTASTYCSSAHMCEVCAGIACASDITPLDPAALPFHYVCVGGAMPTGEVCPGPLPLPMINTPAGTCTDAVIRDADQDLGTSVESTTEAGTLRLDLTFGADSACDLKLSPSGALSSTDREMIHGALLAVDLPNGRGAVVPLKIKVKPGGCTNIAWTCTPQGDADYNTLAACVGQP